MCKTCAQSAHSSRATSCITQSFSTIILLKKSAVGITTRFTQVFTRLNQRFVNTINTQFLSVNEWLSTVSTGLITTTTLKKFKFYI